MENNPLPTDPPVPRTPNGAFAPGNPGRRRGSANKLSRRIVATVLADFEKHHLEILRTLRQDFLAQYVGLLGKLLPRENVLDDSEDAEPLAVAPEKLALDQQSQALAMVADGKIDVEDFAWFAGVEPKPQTPLYDRLRERHERAEAEAAEARAKIEAEEARFQRILNTPLSRNLR